MGSDDSGFSRRLVELQRKPDQTFKHYLPVLIHRLPTLFSLRKCVALAVEEGAAVKNFGSRLLSQHKTELTQAEADH